MLASRIFPAEIQSLTDLAVFLEETLEKAGAEPKEIFDIQLAADEIFTNISSYAYGEEQGVVEVMVKCSEEEISIALIDSGKPFNPLCLPPPDITLGIDERKIGGLGIYLVREMMDTVSYLRENGKNILAIEKRRVKKRE